jgi:hypothetical protein
MRVENPKPCDGSEDESKKLRWRQMLFRGGVDGPHQLTVVQGEDHTLQTPGSGDRRGKSRFIQSCTVSGIRSTSINLRAINYSIQQPLVCESRIT